MTVPEELFLDGRVALHCGDCLAVLDGLPAASVDAVITDPPYHFGTIVKRFGAPNASPPQFGGDGVFQRAAAGFMGKGWDGGYIAFDPATWAKVLRVLKPGGQLAAFSAPKCYHKMAFAIEAAGFEVRDRVVHLYDLSDRAASFLESLSMAQADALIRLLEADDPLGDLFWCFGSGFPKGQDLAKAIDKHRGQRGETRASGEAAKRMIPGAGQNRDGWEKTDGRVYQPGDYVPASVSAQAWDGWNIALKPAYEPIALARKPLAERSVAAQVLATGTGAMNIDRCRVGHTGARNNGRTVDSNIDGGLGAFAPVDYGKGRWPANLTHDGSVGVVAGFPAEAGGQGPASGPTLRRGNDSVARGHFNGLPIDVPPAYHADAGSAARFFYTAKAGADDRLGSGHPTVKPVDLLRWLVRLLTPPGGTVLDPFAGTGTTAEAAWREGFASILVEREAEYQTDIRRRLDLILTGARGRRLAGAKAKADRRCGDDDHGGAGDLRPLRGSRALNREIARQERAVAAPVAGKRGGHG